MRSTVTVTDTVRRVTTMSHHELKMTSIFTGLEFFSKLNGSEMLMMRLNALVGPRESNMAALRRTRLLLTNVRGGRPPKRAECKTRYSNSPTHSVSDWSRASRPPRASPAAGAAIDGRNGCPTCGEIACDRASSRPCCTQRRARTSTACESHPASTSRRRLAQGVLVHPVHRLL